MARHRNQVDAILPKERSARRIIKEQISTIKPVFTELLDNLKISVMTVMSVPLQRR